MERLSYLSVLKNSLFKFTEPSVPKTVNDDKMGDNNINNKDLREEWIYVHDDNASQMDELLDLNDSSEYSIPSVCDTNGMINKKMSNLSTFEREQQEKKAKEIIKNRNAWLEKRKKEKLNSQNIVINKNIRSKVNKRRRNTNSTSSNGNSSFEKDVNSSSNINISNLFDENSNFVKNSMKYTTESVVNSSDIINNHHNNNNKDNSSPYNLRSKSNKKPKLQNLSRCKPNHKFTTLNQPMAKGMC